MNIKTICIISFPVGKSGLTPLSNIVSIICALADHVWVISGEEKIINEELNLTCVNYYKITHMSGSNKVFRVYNYVITQLKICKLLMHMAFDVNFFIFLIGGECLIIPMSLLKLFRKKIIRVCTGSSSNVEKLKGLSFSNILRLLEKISNQLSDIIVVESNDIVNIYGLESCNNKIRVGCEHYIENKVFKSYININERRNIIGYIGRLSEEKGILNFLKAMPFIISKIKDIQINIIGDGALKKEIIDYIENNNLKYNVNLIGWVDRFNIPNYLNEFKLIVLPSFTEGLPNILLEAMSCGTPVLTTSVGAIPDIIIDEYNGFIMENNSPDCIAYNVIRALNHHDLEKISINSISTIEKSFSYISVVERWNRLFSSFKESDQ